VPEGGGRLTNIVGRPLRERDELFGELGIGIHAKRHSPASAPLIYCSITAPSSDSIESKISLKEAQFMTNLP